MKSKKTHTFCLVLILFLLSYEEGFKGVRVFVKYGNGLVILYSLILFFKNQKLSLDDKTPFFNYFVIGTMLFYALNCLLVLFSDVEFNLITPIILTISYVSLCISFYRIFKSSLIDFIADVFIFFGCLSAIIAITTLFTGTLYFGPLQFDGGFDKFLRIYGWFGSPNRLGSLLGVSIISLVFKALKLKKIPKINIVYFVILVITLLLTGSRGSMLSTIISLLIFFILNNKINLKKLLVSIVPMVIIGTILLNTISDTYKFSYDVYLDQFIRIDQTDFAREEINDNAMDLFSKQSTTSFLFGSGQGFTLASIERSAHNGFVSFLIDNGILYLSFMISLILVSITKLYHKRKFGDRNTKISMFFLISLLFFMALRELTNNQGMLSSGIYNLIFIFILTQNFIRKNENFISTQ